MRPNFTECSCAFDVNAECAAIRRHPVSFLEPLDAIELRALGPNIVGDPAHEQALIGLDAHPVYFQLKKASRQLAVRRMTNSWRLSRALSRLSKTARH